MWFNWRDVRNPEAGGAEIYTHNIAKRLVEKGFEVTLFTSSFEGSRSEEILDGVEVIRRGGRFSVYKEALRFCQESWREYDVIVDEINTRPFMTFKCANRDRIIALIHQLAREFWLYEMPVVGLVGYLILERLWLRAYRDIKTVTVSKSTHDDLVSLGFRDISIVPNGVNVEPVDRVPCKEARPTVVFVGRMKRAKKPEDAIKAFLLAKKIVEDAQLWMIGDGYLRGRLERKYGGEVKFFGYLPSQEKNELVSRAWVIAVPGVREGWGQVVTDANALGTPAVGYDIPGLRDSILHGYNGFLVERTPESMARALAEILTDEDLRMDLSRNSIRWARNFNWDTSAELFAEVITGLRS